MGVMRKDTSSLRFLLATIIFLYALFGTAQSTCPNADFESGNFSGWNGFRGSCCPITANNPGIVNGRHTIMSGGGMDPFSNGTLPVVAPGGSYSARLGNSGVGAQAERLTYSFLVDVSNALFIYRYAVVFEDPNHTAADQPRFQINVYDQGGAAIPCGTYEVVSSAGIPGFETYTTPFGDVIHYTNWTSVAIDLTPYIGQTVTIDFAVGDCEQGGHFGYAYLDASCGPLEISSDLCQTDQTATMSAPAGFAHYLWSTGDTTATVTVPNPTVGTTYTVTITSFTGCVVELDILIQPTVIVADIAQSSPCQSTTLFSDATTVEYGSPVTQWFWDFGDGQTSTEQNPDHYYQQAGTYLATLTVTNATGCSDSATQDIFILPYPDADFSYDPVCPGEPIMFVDETQDATAPIGSWHWDFGDATSDQQNPQHDFSTPPPFNVSLVVADTAGCRDTVAYVVNYSPSAVASFIHASSTCNDGGTQFTNTSTSVGTTITSLTWNFGDNSPIVSGQQAPYHVYAQSGQYTATLIVTDASGCSDTTTAVVGVQSAIQAGFTHGLSCSSDTTFFVDASSTNFGNIVQWDWDFGDGTPMQSGEQVGHVYQANGQYEVELFITLDNGCSDSTAMMVDVLLSPVAIFVFDPACPGDPVQLTSQVAPGSSAIVQHSWDLGDGTPTVSTQNVQHAYAVDSLYIVTYQVVDAAGCIDDTQQTVQTLPAPVASYFVPQGCADFTVPFDNLSSIASGTITAITWNFGDGSGASTFNAAHTFDDAGTYFVDLTVVSDSGCIGSITNEVVISDNPISDFTSNLACIGGTVSIVDQSIAQNGSIVTHQWSIDEGVSWTTGGPSLDVSFPDAGWHEIGLITTNSAGCTDTTYDNVLVLEPPMAMFIADSVCEGLTTTLWNTSMYLTGLPTAYQWTIDGQTSNAFDNSYMFSQHGSYPVSLRMEYIGLDACADSVTANVIVHPNPTPDVLAVPELCESSLTSLRDMSTIVSGYIAQWEWTFENGRVSVVQNPVIPYMDEGVYDVHLAVTSENGCRADTTFSDLVTVLPSPVAHFTASPNDVSVLDGTVAFNNTSAYSDVYWWSFGDGTFSSEYEPVHDFVNAGEYDVMLIAYNYMGCADTMRIKLHVNDMYALYIPNTFTPNSDGINDRFGAKGVGIEDFELFIFNRWGELIHHSQDISIGWDGVYDGVLSQIDVYVYKVLFTDVFGHHHVLYGHVNLVR